MSETATLRPRLADLIVRDPVTRAPLAAAGEPKPLNNYWRRRLLDGDVVRVPPPAAAPAPVVPPTPPAPPASTTAPAQE